jgi:uncharacterized protein with FMN-binding domain
MKNILLFIVIFAVISACAALGGIRGSAANVYEGTALGYRGPIRVLVRVSDGSITEIEIVESEEDAFVGGAAMEELLDMVILYNSTDIDAVSGATESSRGFLEAVENAIMNL